MALFFLFFLSIFFISLYNMLTLKICVGVFSGSFIARMWTMSCCIAGLRIELLALILPFISPFFCLLRLNLCHSFLRNCTR